MSWNFYKPNGQLVLPLSWVPISILSDTEQVLEYMADIYGDIEEGKATTTSVDVTRDRGGNDIITITIERAPKP